ncbi:MAG: hypothetical protein QOJ08_1333 [Ilumatobacteraceae bacterium]
MILTENVLLVTTAELSVTLTTMLYVASAVGVPDKTPAALIDRPGGRPDVTVHVYGIRPPVAAIVVDVYTTPF